MNHLPYKVSSRLTPVVFGLLTWSVCNAQNISLSGVDVGYRISCGCTSYDFQDSDSLGSLGKEPRIEIELEKFVEYPGRNNASVSAYTVANAHAAARKVGAGVLVESNSSDIGFAGEPANPVAWARATITDWIAFESPGVSNGTLMDVVFKVPRLSGALSLGGSGEPSPGAWNGISSIQWTISLGSNQTATGREVIRSADYQGGLAFNNTEVKDFYPGNQPGNEWRAVIGRPTKLTVSIEATAGITAYGYETWMRGSNHAAALFENTLNWSGISGLKLLDGTPVQEWTLQSQLGTDWSLASPVPEPRSGLLLLIGLTWIVCLKQFFRFWTPIHNRRLRMACVL